MDWLGSQGKVTNGLIARVDVCGLHGNIPGRGGKLNCGIAVKGWRRCGAIHRTYAWCHGSGPNWIMSSSWCLGPGSRRHTAPPRPLPKSSFCDYDVRSDIYLLGSS